MSTTSSAAADKEESRLTQWKTALEHLQTALRILDATECPPQVGAQVDLAIHRLRDAIENPGDDQTSPGRADDPDDCL